MIFDEIDHGHQRALSPGVVAEKMDDYPHGTIRSSA
jgi:hypothetical protein